MLTYIILGKYTQQGIANMKESPARLDAVRWAFQEAGGELKEFYLTTGHYDFVAIADVPNAETMAKLLLSAAAQGNVTTQTLGAFTEDEYRRITAGLT